MFISENHKTMPQQKNSTDAVLGCEVLKVCF